MRRIYKERKEINEADVLDSLTKDFVTTVTNLNRHLQGEDPQTAVAMGRKLATKFFENAQGDLADGFLEEAEEYM